jgi:hypothetical protein
MSGSKKEEKSVKITVTIKMGKNKKLTLDNDDARDLYFKLKEIYDKYTYVTYTYPYIYTTPWIYYNSSSTALTNPNSIPTYTTTASVDSVTTSVDSINEVYSTDTFEIKVSNN